ncbi:Dihydrolipoyl dehydrogenase, mitochondrial [Chlamydiales bacterium STE3]|nr:Dihydrolipoyl dehydrogenase, mitochondrial [Chlamydiales bacterium STE3]
MMFDVIVIGSGPGGYVAAIRASQLGFKVACIEKRATFGGTCLNIGCIPSKALLYSTELLDLVRKKGQNLGVECSGLNYNFDAMMQRKQRVVKASSDGVDYLFKKNGVEVIHGTATLLSPNTVQVEQKVIEAKHVILATGSEPAPLPFLPFDGQVVISSTEALSLTNVPKKLGIIGGGVIGVELASVYQRLGAEVTIIEMLPEICAGIDLALLKPFHKALTEQGLTIHTSTQLREGIIGNNQVTLKAQKGDENLALEVDKVLVAVGRRPFSRDLGLKEIGVVMDTKGFVKVDNNFSTSIPNIFAIGDLIEGPMLAHKASEEGIAVAEIIAGLKPVINYLAIPNIIYTHPEVASIGFTEEEARRSNLEIFTGHCPIRFNPRARCIEETEGLVKVIGEKKSGRLIGMHIFSGQASELIAEGVLAIEKNATVEELATSPNGHPTLSEAIKEACLAALGRPINL